MAVMAAVPADDPLMVAWESYQETEDFKNTKRWAKNPEHLQGSLWAAFMSGFRAGNEGAA